MSPADKLSDSELAAVLSAEGIKHFDAPIVKMSRKDLRKYFGAKSTGRINLSLLIKNIIWQVHEGLVAGELLQFEGNIRSFWYVYVKPTLSRAGALRDGQTPYKVVIDMFVRLVMARHLLNYRDFGFEDERKQDRKIGDKNAHVLVVAEKRGHFPLLTRITEAFDVTVVSLGGMPSLLSSEYFVEELSASGVALDQDFPLLTVVDYDPAGDAIVRTFMRQMKELGVQRLVRTDLVKPANMTADQVRLNKYRLSRKKHQRKKIARWMGLTEGIDRKPYGLEADAMPAAQLMEVFEREVAVYLKLGVLAVRRRRQKARLSRLLKGMILKKLGLG